MVDRPAGFISAQRALTAYEDFFDGIVDLKSNIAEYLWDGRLKAKCAYTWTTKSNNLRKGRREDPKLETYEYQDVPPSYWRRSGLNKVRYSSAWYWRNNLFFVPGDSKYQTLVYFKSVCFDEEALDKLLGVVTDSGRKGVGGRRANQNTWNRFFLYMIREAHNDAFRSGKYSSPNEMAISASAALDDHRENTLLPMCQHIWRLLVEPEYSHGPVTGELELPEPDDDA